MKIGRAILLGTLLAAMLLASGCKRKKPPVPPPQANAPTVTEPAPQPAPPATTEETKPEPSATTPPAPAPEPTVEKPKPKPRLRRPRISAKKEPPKEPAKEPPKPPRTVVPEGGSPAGGQLSAGIPDESATHQKFNTAQLLEATDYNLKSVTRTLTADEQAMVQHIRSYMAQSREATQQGDTQRAYNLALKAHLLSDEIVKR